MAKYPTGHKFIHCMFLSY